jgi:purine catabolism regulator
VRPIQGPITVHDILQRPVFREAQLAAGAGGVHRTVRWLHILEVLDVAALIHGNELVLTTGTGFHQSTDKLTAFVEQLFRSGAAGLCIELGTSIQEIPAAVIRFADENEFPVIVFPSQVRFVDLTQDVHSFILNRQHTMLDDLEKVAGQLQRLIVKTGSLRQILALVQKVTGASVVYGRLGQRPSVMDLPFRLPPLEADWLQDLAIPLEQLSQPAVIQPPAAWLNGMDHGLVWIAQSLTVLGMIRGVFVLVCPRHLVDEFAFLLVDKAVGALSQAEFYQLSLQERQMFYEQDLVDQLIRGETGELSKPAEDETRAAHTYYQVVVIDNPEAGATLSDLGDEEWFNRRAELAMTARLAFARQRFRPFLAVHHDKIIAILEIEIKQADVKGRVELALQHFSAVLNHAETVNAARCAGIGRDVHSLAETKQSYEDALIAFRIAEKSQTEKVVLYHEAGIYRWLALLASEPQSGFIAELDIRGVAAYDQQHHTGLLETLKMYLDCNMSKQETADRLFIHRQTLYHRLKQIHDLLPVDLNDPKARLSLHVSLYHYDFSRRNG